MTIDWAQRLHDARHLAPAALLGCTPTSSRQAVHAAWEALDVAVRQARSELDAADARHRQFEELAQAALDARDMVLAALEGGDA